MQTIRYLFDDGSVKSVQVPEPQGVFRLKRSELPSGVRGVELFPDFFTAQTGDRGALVIPSLEGSHHASLTRFRERPDTEEVYTTSSMPVYGWCRNGEGMLAIVRGMRFDYELVLGVKAGRYYLYPRFTPGGESAWDDIVVEFLPLSGSEACWQGMARRYRRDRLARGECRTLAERVRENPVLAELCEGIEIRIRLAWKPVPSAIDDQTPDNEPPVHAELTFRQLDEIIEELHRQGIAHANLCIVGWNAGGHDGRFPDLLPAEPACGTLEEFKAVIAKAKRYGYLISCHTNLLEGYSIAERFDIENTLRLKDGSPKRGGNWGGGKSYYLCPKQAYEKYFAEDMATLKELGCRGAHYFDVFSIVPPDACHHKDHPLTKEENALWRCRMLDGARRAIGASASEGSWDFCADALDYVLYAAFWFEETEHEYRMCDKYIPFWFMVYHGILLYNGFAPGVNANLKHDKRLRLYNYAWGGRPLNYINSRFIKGTNPWGDEDLRYEDAAAFSREVMTVKLDYDLYRMNCRLQFEAIVDYQEPQEGLLVTTYEHGRKMIANVTGEPVLYDGTTLDPWSFTVR